jgi:hypothetical protein
MTEVFCVQDRTGTSAQLTIAGPTTSPIEVTDTGTYSGDDWEGLDVGLAFTVARVNDTDNFCITTMTPEGASGNVLLSNWPKKGTITWLTGSNAVMSPNSTVVLAKYPANAYIDTDYFLTYHASRGNTVVASPLDPIRRAIVKGTDYINQRYRFKGIKLLQYLGNSNLDPRVVDPWFAFMTFGAGFGSFAGTPLGFGSDIGDVTSQFTEWPRQGAIDFNGDNVYGVPKIIQDAVCEAALRELNGTPLQPDYDPEVVTAGGVLQTVTDEVGPLKFTRTYDTKLGLSFFPSIPQINRMLSKAGILLAGGGRTIIR